MNTHHLSSVMDALPAAMLLIGDDERIEAVNRRATALLGGDFTGRHHVTALRQPALLDAIDAVLSGGAARDAPFQGNDAGQETSYRAHCAPVLREGAGTAVMVSFSDTTDLQTADRMRRDFVANVSHELRTPLTALLGFIETLRGPARDDKAAQDRFLAIMEDEAGRMNRLVRDLLSLSRVEELERRRPAGTVNISTIVQSAVTALRLLAEQEGVRLHVAMPAQITPVVGDADQLQQVITNLVENAVKYGRKGGAVSVQVTEVQDAAGLRGPGVRIDVTDTGEGIAERHLARLTERFYRVDPHRSRELGGTGLGLAIVKHIVNRHRGRLRIRSAPGKGSCFSVVLPVD